MAINFPNSPADGDIYGNYTYSASVPGWRKTPENAASLPAGTIVQWSAANPPSNWLTCDGSAVSRTTYASLFAAIGIQFGAGDGSTTFNLPDLRGRVAVGKNSGTFATLGGTGGAETHTLTSSQIPSHSHPNTLSNNVVASSTHTHGSSGMTAAAYVGYWATRTGSTNWTATNTGGFSAPGGNTTNSNLGTAIIGNTDGPSATTTVGITNANNTGGDGSHNNLQPYLVLNYIIKISAGITSGDSELATRVGAIETTTVRSVALGGTGASTLTSGAYLKGAGTSAITTQTGIPATDLTGTIDVNRMPTGSVVQVVQTNFITRSSQSYSNATATDITGLSASITPKSTNSRIMIFVRWFGEFSPADAPYNTVFGVKRNGTRVGEGTDNGSTLITAITAPALSYEGTDASSTAETASFFYLDSPSTTSAITYQVFFISNVGAGTAVVAHNKTYNWSGQSVGFELGTSNITLMEVA